VTDDTIFECANDSVTRTHARDETEVVRKEFRHDLEEAVSYTTGYST
jgi:hypothetical protein